MVSLTTTLSNENVLNGQYNLIANAKDFFRQTFRVINLMTLPLEIK